MAGWNSWIRRNGSDLLLVADAPAAIRIEGVFPRWGIERLSGRRDRAAVLPALAAHAREEYQQYGIADSSYRVEGLGPIPYQFASRARARGRNRPGIAIGILLSKNCISLPEWGSGKLQRGLVIIGGATGSGKIHHLAALVNEINRESSRHIVTIEDPIEYEHQHNRSVVEQVEIGIDAPDFPTALRAAMRQAPDVIVVGEMRDPETARIALSAAETGHLGLYDSAYHRCRVHGVAHCGFVSAGTAAFDSRRRWPWHWPRCLHRTCFRSGMGAACLRRNC